MKLTLNWLRDFVDVDIEIDELVELLVLSGTKVVSVHNPAKGIAGVVVAEVLEVGDHPNADNLTMVDVRIDGDRTQRVVCGARNFAPGDRVPLATLGARLPGLPGIEVGERKIRGEISRGMLCSGFELGVSRDHEGILILPADAPLGEDVVPVLGLDDTIIELEITLNRPDCMSVLGIAREVAALLGKELRRPEIDVEPAAGAKSPAKVRIEDPRGCPRYLARYIEGVKIGPSPQWLTARLVACGVRPISNVVDITNYVLLELGQPLHAFDASKISGNTIVVRRARKGERLLTLDEVERELDAEDLLIADPERALAMAGVMGGGESEVSDATTAVILEAAYFDPDTVAFTARRHQMRTEASARFERGMDPEMVPVAAARACKLMAELAAGGVAPQVVDEYPQRVERPRLRLRPGRTDKLLGVSIPPTEQARLLRSVAIEVEDSSGVIEAQVPSFRPDLKREVDLVEEVARLYGYNKLPSTLPPGRAGTLTRDQGAERALKRQLVDLGLFEAWTPSLIRPSDLDALGLPGDHPARQALAVWNPMSEDESVMRTTLLPSLLKAVARNQAHRAPGVALFEVARVYEPTGERLAREGLVLAAAFSGVRSPQGWLSPERRWDFFTAKGIAEAALRALGVGPARFVPATGLPFHPTRAASVHLDEHHLGAFGEFHPEVCERFGVAEGTVAFEFALAPVFAAMPGKVQAREPGRFPANFIDLAVIVDDEVPSDFLLEIIVESGAPEVTSVRLFDLYRGEQVPDGKKSVAFALELRLEDRTLTDEEAVAVRDRIVPALAERTGATLRG